MPNENAKVTLDSNGVPMVEVRGWTTHDSTVRLFYHGPTADFLEIVLPPSSYREPKGGPERRSTVHLADLHRALDALTASPSVEPVAWQAMKGDGTPRIWDGDMVVVRNRDDAKLFHNTEGAFERPLYASPSVGEDTRRAVMFAIEQAVKSCAAQAKYPTETWMVDYAKILDAAMGAVADKGSDL